MRRSCRAPLTLLAVAVLLAAVGCRSGRSPAESPTKARAKGHRIVQDVLHAYGGAAALGKVRAFRAEGIYTGTGRGEQRDLTRWFERPDRLRMETRYPDHGEIHITGGGAGWVGPDENHLQPVTGLFLEALLLEAARLDLPLRLAEQESSLVWMPSDAEKRVVLRMPLESGLFVDYHVNPKDHRIERVETPLSGAPTARFSANLSEFRWVHGVLFPFREDAYVGGTKAGIVRFRSVKTNPEISPGLLAPPRL